MKERHTILRVITKLLIPYIFLFGLYVQFHGDYGPGGGFQAGVIIAAAFVLFGLVFGPSEAQRVAKPSTLRGLAAFGVLLYAGVGVVSMFKGGNFLDYGVLDPHDPEHGQHLGILIIEAGVGITVASVMTLIYYAFATFGKSQ